MYTISVWAAQHKWPARIAIVVSYVLLNGLGLFIGDGLQLFQISIPLFFFYAAVVLFLATFLLYPEKGRRQRPSHSYRYRKTFDLILISTSFFFVVCIGNQPQRFMHWGTQPAAATSIFITNSLAEKPALKKVKPAKKWKHKIFERSLRQILVERVQVLRETYKKTSKGGKIALVVLSVIVALGLLLLVGSLSCSLSCSGSDGAAVLVAILGVSLVTFLLVRVIQRIFRKPNPAEPVETTPPAT